MDTRSLVTQAEGTARLQAPAKPLSRQRGEGEELEFLTHVSRILNSVTNYKQASTARTLTAAAGRQSRYARGEFPIGSKCWLVD